MLFTFSWMLSSEIKNTWWWLHHRQILNQCLTAHHCSDFKCMQYQRPWGRTGVGQHPQLTLGMRCCLQRARAPSPPLHSWGGTGHLGRDLCYLHAPPCATSQPLEPGSPYPLFPVLGTSLLSSRMLMTSWGVPLPPKKVICSNFWNTPPQPIFHCFFTPPVSFSIPKQAFSPVRIFFSHFQHFLFIFCLI